MNLYLKYNLYHSTPIQFTQDIRGNLFFGLDKIVSNKQNLSNIIRNIHTDETKQIYIEIIDLIFQFIDLYITWLYEFIRLIPIYYETLNCHYLTLLYDKSSISMASHELSNIMKLFLGHYPKKTKNTFHVIYIYIHRF